MKILCNLNMKKSILFIFSVIILQLSFNYNFFKAASDGFFNRHQKDSEVLVVGKMVNSWQNGIFTSNAMGRYSYIIQDTYNLYLSEKLPNKKYNNYDSSFGLQGYIYSVFDYMLDMIGVKDTKKRLAVLYFLTSLALSVTMAWFIVLVYKEFGVTPAFILLLGVAYSQWVVVFAKNLYWVIFLLFLPFVYSWHILDKYKEKIPKKFYIILFLIIFLKCLCGFEYLSTIFISFGIPFLYFAFKDNWSIKILFKKLFIVYAFALSAFIASVVSFLLQKYIVFGTWEKAGNFLKYIILKRTHGNPDQVPERLKRSLESGIFEVIEKYIKGTAFDFGYFGYFSFGGIILLFVLMIVILLFRRRCDFSVRNKEIAFIIVSAISISAPLSWHILAKGHSYIHTHMNHILWYSPFVFLVFVAFGLVLRMVKLKYISSFVLIVLLPFGFMHDLKYRKKINNIFEYSLGIWTTDGNLTISIDQDNQKLIYAYSDCKNKDITTRFFLHFYPENLNDVSAERRKKGHKFDNYDFKWKEKN